MKIIIKNVRDIGDDILLVEAAVEETPEGEESEGKEPTIIRALGWVSATTNHFDAQDYQEDGHRKPDAQPRSMTEEEKFSYLQKILITQNRLGY